jgi:ADP-ribose pyrophosphatase YjhB (NUDIX family)
MNGRRLIHKGFLIKSLTHTLEIQGRTVTFTWVGHTEAEPARVHALAFTSEHEILLVSGGPEDPNRWLPGGGVEPGESPEQALQRELLEEADAQIEACEDLGSQRIDDSDGRLEYHRLYWCRVTLLPQAIVRQESTLRHLVAPSEFLDRLEWGYTEIASLLLALALEKDQQY